MLSALEGAALVLVDFQVGMDDPAWGPRNNPEAEENALRLLQAWRKAGKRLYHVQHVSLEPNSVFRAERPGVAMKPQLAPLPGEPLIQKRASRPGSSRMRRPRSTASASTAPCIPRRRFTR